MFERLTYRHLWQLFGLTITAIVGYLWAFDKPIPIHGLENRHEPVAYLLAAVGGMTFFLVSTFFPKLVSDKPIRAKIDDAPLTETQRERNRRAMLDLVENIWIKGFLDNVLNEMRSLNLDMSFADPEKVLQRPGMKDYTLPDSHAIAQAYYDLNRRLVILGEPGSGKTVLLLQLAKKLIADAQKDNLKPIPVILTLSSWAAKQLPFEAWLKGEVGKTYGLSTKIVNNLVEGEQLTYLLDGLDEVAEAHREDCFKAIKQFVEQERRVDYVVCCRKQEFLHISTQLSVAGEIVIQPLTQSQIEEYLKGHEWDGLRLIRADNAVIRGFSQIPFMLNTLAFVTRGKSKYSLILDISTFETEALLRDHFLDSYVSLRMHQHVSNRYTNLLKTRTYLKWLAQQLAKHEETDFYIENLQPMWLVSRKRYQNYYRAVRFGIPSFFFLLFGSVFSLRGGLAFGLIVGIMSALITSAVIDRQVKRSDSQMIDLYDRLHWWLNRRLILYILRNTSFKSELGYPFLKLMIWMSLFVLLALLPTPKVAFQTKLEALLMGLLLSIFLGLSLGGTERLNTPVLRRHPNAAFRNSLSNYLVASLFIALPFLLLNNPLGITIGAAFGLHFGGYAVLQHMWLRYFLWREGHIPLWRYDKFLDYMAKLVILRKVGGGYRFVHDYLRQYLASAAFVPDPMEKAE